MRQSLLTNLLNIISKNNNRGFNNLGFFEIGKTFNRCKIDDENCVVAGVRSGENVEKNIYEKPRNFDVFDVKKDLCDSLAVFGINGEKMPITSEAPKYYHPNRSGSLLIGKNTLACFGELHPEVIKHFKLKNRVVAFELFLDKLPKKLFLEEKSKAGFKPNDFQIIERDLSFMVDSKAEVGNIIKDIYGVDKNYIQNVSLFDVYQKSEELTKSIAFNIKIQPQDENRKNSSSTTNNLDNGNYGKAYDDFSDYLDKCLENEVQNDFEFFSYEEDFNSTINDFNYETNNQENQNQLQNENVENFNFTLGENTENFDFTINDFNYENYKIDNDFNDFVDDIVEDYKKQNPDNSGSFPSYNPF